MNQTDIVLNHMMTNGSITSMDAFSEYGITRLSATIYKLRHAGYPVVAETEENTNRFGKTVRYARYYLAN